MPPRTTAPLASHATLALLSLTAMDTLQGAPDWEASALATWQAASDSRVRDEFQGSADLLLQDSLGPGLLSAHFEASTTPRDGGVSALLAEANGDAGSALDAGGHGRVQLSELTYTLPAGPGELGFGLIDTTGPLDNSDVANDADTQFLGTGLNNNPTIEFPDYTLGAFYQLLTDADGDQLVLVAAGSQGLGDADDTGYGSLFDLGEAGRGLFLATEWQTTTDHGTARLGGWTHTADHAALAGGADDLANYGIYASIDRQINDVALNLRLGAARESVSEAARFIGLAATMPLTPSLHLGLGGAWTFASGELADAGDRLQGEVYAHWQASGHLHISPSVQYLRNSGFDASGSSVDAEQWLVGLRAGYQF